MVRSQSWLFRTFAVSVVSALLIAACGTGTTPTGPATTAGPGVTAGPGATETSKKGGTLFLLQPNTSLEWNQIDPQRAYTGEDLAFFGATIYRSLVAYKIDPDPVQGTSLVPDMATDLGTPNADGSEWSFTLRDGLTWQDGSAVTCADLKYGVSRTFANNVINQGPTYAVAYLDIPANPITDEKDKKSGFLSGYYGPYDKTGQEDFDKAVTCDGNKITFKLNGPHADFNYTTTLGFGAVPNPTDHPGVDSGETYGQPGHLAWSNGPYMVESYSTGNGGKMILVRNPNWKESSDTYRKAYPDKWQVDFGIDPKVLDQRLITPSGDDQFGMQYGGVQPENLATLFADSDTALPEYASRAISGFDPYSRYYYVNVQKVKNVKHRQAMAVALDRKAILANVGGDFYGGYGDGFIKPNIGADYAETGFYTKFFGQAVPDSGDPELAKKLITESGEPMPALTFDFSDSPTNGRTAAIVIASLGLAGITVTANPIPSGYYSVVFTNGHEFGVAGWGADWPNASTVIPPLFTDEGGWNLSHVKDAAFEAKIGEAFAQTDRAKQALLWQDLNKYATENVFAIPTFFGKSQTIAGDRVAPVYRWAAYGSWPYAEMYVIQ
ncbi:MAG: ABC transporter substrate-binding protein [Candidatus Limnocylindrales bacterium]